MKATDKKTSGAGKPAPAGAGRQPGKKNTTVIVIAIVIILATLLTVGFVVAAAINKKPSGDLVPAPYTYEAFSADPVSATAVSWTENGKTVSLSFRDGAWTWADDPEMPIGSDQVKALLVPLVSLKSTKRYTDTSEEEREGFGLKEPALSVTVTDGAYGTRTLNFGKYSAAAGGYYAQRADAPGTVYVVKEDAYKAFSGTTPTDLLYEGEYPLLTAATLDGFDLTVDGNTFRFLYDIRGIEKNGSVYYWFVSVNGDANKPVDTNADNLCMVIIGMNYDRLLSWHAGDLATYGVGDDSPVITVHYTETVTVSTGDGNRYERQPHSISLRFGKTGEDLADYVNPVGTTLLYELSAGNILNELLAVARKCL